MDLFPAVNVAAATGGGNPGEPRHFPAGHPGVILGNSMVTFDRADGSTINLIGKSKRYSCVLVSHTKCLFMSKSSRSIDSIHVGDLLFQWFFVSIYTEDLLWWLLMFLVCVVFSVRWPTDQ